MNHFVFKTKWVALAFAALTLFTAYMVADGSTSEGPPDASSEISDTPPEVGQATPEAALPPPPDQMDDSEFVDDEALIDDANGDAPSPPDGGDGSSDDDYGASNDGDSGNSVVSSQPPQYTPDGTPIVPGA